MVEIINILSVIAFAAAGVCLLLVVFVWFRFSILSVINDLSGKTAKKAIEQIRSNNMRTGDKSYRSSPVNISRGPLTEPMPAVTAAETEKLPGEQVGSLTPETTLLREDGKTELLLNNESTTVLNNGTENVADVSERAKAEITIIEKVVLINTSEVIP